MQQALLIDEVIRHIFYHCAEDGSGTLNALARSCRAWRDPALDFLWLRLSCIAPLLHLIPGVELVDGVYASKDDCSSLDMSRFHIYACRVKHISHRQKARVNPTLLSILIPSRSIPLLPSLRSAHLLAPNCDEIQACLSISVKLNRLDLDLGFKSKSTQPSNQHMRQYLQDIVRTAPSLQHLNIRGSLPGSFLELVSSMQNLRTLSLRLGSSLTTDVLVTVTNFPNLSKFEVHAGHIDADALLEAFHNQGLPTFPSLEKLHIRAYGPVLQLLIERVPVGSLRALRIEAEEPTGIPVSWNTIFQLISSKAADALESLTIEHHIELDDVGSNPSDHTSNSSPGGTKFNTPIPFLDLQILAPLRLRRLVLDTTLPPAICDDELAILVKGWPELEHLDIGSVPPSEDQPKYLTLKALEIFARGAPKLAGLVMPANLRATDFSNITTGLPAQHALTCLTLACTPLPNLAQAAEFLHQLFPSMVNIEGLPGQNDAWATVQGTLRTKSPHLPRCLEL